jgi:hypothetical protein
LIFFFDWRFAAEAHKIRQHIVTQSGAAADDFQEDMKVVNNLLGQLARWAKAIVASCQDAEVLRETIVGHFERVQKGASEEIAQKAAQEKGKEPSRLEKKEIAQKAAQQKGSGAESGADSGKLSRLQKKESQEPQPRSGTAKGKRHSKRKAARQKGSGSESSADSGKLSKKRPPKGA